MVLEAYAAQATREAIESGMARPELIAILDGLSVTELVPPHAESRSWTTVSEPRANSWSATSPGTGMS